MPSQKSAPSAAASGELALAPWEFAGLLVTYWCSSRCAFCYVNAGPEQGGAMSVETALDLWRSLDRLAAAHGKVMRVHLAGGEPFRDWVHLVAMIRAAREAGLTPAEKVETNAFWAVDAGLTRARLELLRALGVGRIVVSADVFHQEHVPFERVRRCVEAARAVFGREGVRVRWWDFYERPIDTRALSAAEKEAAFRAAMARHRERLCGRAAFTLAPLLPGQPAAAFRGQSCGREILQSRHVHIDPYGHVFPGTCAGIILGRADGSGAGSVEQVWRTLAEAWRDHGAVAVLVAGGSYELYERARAEGYVERAGGYADKCHLCTEVRTFLRGRGGWSRCFGPGECYACGDDRGCVS